MKEIEFIDVDKLTKKFDLKRALSAIQGSFVVIDEDSAPFEWVGSSNALPCIIILISGRDENGKKIAACGHLSNAESTASISHMKKEIGMKEISSVYLVSGRTKEDDPLVQAILDDLKKETDIAPYVSLGKRERNAAINVHTGEVINDVDFRLQNAGKQDLNYSLEYLNLASFRVLNNHMFNKPLPPLQLSIDGRKPEQREAISRLLETCRPFSTPGVFFESTGKGSSAVKGHDVPLPRSD